MKARILGVLAAACMGATGCDPECDQGQVRVGSTCRALETPGPDSGARDSGSDGGDSEPPSKPPDESQGGPMGAEAVCGDGELRATETCDDGNKRDGDGCSSECTTEPGFACAGQSSPASTCGRVPAAPALQGEAVAGHANLTFAWTLPTYTTGFLISLDGAPSSWVEAATTRISYPNTPSGNHTFRVRACSTNDIAFCSEVASFTTKVESYGSTYPKAWSGVKRDLTMTALGHVTPIACDNCYDGPNGEALSPADARTLIATALSRGADLIEVDIIAVNDKLYVAKDDTLTPDALIAFSEIIAEPALLVSDALLALELRETGMEPNAFAQLLLRELASAAELWGPGRPLVVRAASARESYLSALRVKSEPFKIHYLKTWVLQSPAPAYASQGEAAIVTRGHTGIEIPPFADNLFGRIRRAQAQNLAVSIGPVPGPAFYGQGILLGLRDIADGFSANYRVDQARALVSSENGAGFIDASKLDATSATASSRLSRVLVNDSPATFPQAIGVAPNGAVKGTPTIQVLDANSALVGGAFDFSSENLGLTLWETAVGAGAKEGSFLSTTVTLPGAFLSASDGATTNLVGTCTASPSGACLQLQNGTTTTVKQLELATAVSSAWQLTPYPQAGQSDPGCPAGARFTDTLNAERGYWIVGLRPANGPSVLLIDGLCAAVSTAPGALVPGNGKTTLGPHAARPGGLIQVGDVQLLPDTGQHGVN